MFARKHPDMPAMTKQQERSRRVSLIGMYILGIAIGCVLVQLMLQMKRAMLAPRQPAPAQQGASPTSQAPATKPVAP